MSSFGEGIDDLTIRALSQRLDGFPKDKGVDKEGREALTGSFDLALEYICWAHANKKNSKDPKALSQFLSSKPNKLLAFLGSDPVDCGIALVEFIDSVKDARKISSAFKGFLPPSVLMWGLATLDLIELGNSCTPVRSAYYQLFLKKSSVRLNRLRESSPYAPQITPLH